MNKMNKPFIKSVNHQMLHMTPSDTPNSWPFLHQWGWAIVSFSAVLSTSYTAACCFTGTARIVGFPIPGKAVNSWTCCFSTEDFHRVSLEFPCWETQEYWHTQNARLSKSLQMCCHQDNFMVVNQKVVKVVSIDNQKVLTMTTQIGSS